MGWGSACPRPPVSRDTGEPAVHTPAAPVVSQDTSGAPVQPTAWKAPSVMVAPSLDTAARAEPPGKEVHAGCAAEPTGSTTRAAVLTPAHVGLLYRPVTWSVGVSRT